MTITDVQIRAGRPIRRTVFVDGRPALDISDEIYVQFALYKGREIDHQTLASARQADEILKARAAALYFIAPRMRSRQEIARRLHDRGFSSAVVETTIAFLVQYGMVDDASFAGAYVHDRLLRRPIGRRKLAGELRTRGVDPETADRALSALDHDRECELARLAMRSKIRTLRNGDERKRQRSIAGFLAARGFSWEVIRAVILDVADDADPAP